MYYVMKKLSNDSLITYQVLVRNYILGSKVKVGDGP
jgi:hypothetical protein